MSRLKGRESIFNVDFKQKRVPADMAKFNLDLIVTL